MSLRTSASSWLTYCKLYVEFKNAYIAAYPDMKKDIAYKTLQKLWNECKRSTDDVKRNILKFKTITANRQGKLLSMWCKTAAGAGANGSASAVVKSQLGSDLISLPSTSDGNAE
jgi:hypothetical protein